MAWVLVLGWAAVAVGVVGYVLGLRGSRRRDDTERGLLLWVVAAWLGVALLVGSELG
ncbi:MAG TPA: hypothetical protein VHO27_16460 [Angustibacter sp.]|nr:hypothetical protein [Angustibacter sp.]